MTTRDSKRPANTNEQSSLALIALVRLLARQAAREALAETNSHHDQNKALPGNSSGEEDGA